MIKNVATSKKFFVITCIYILFSIQNRFFDDVFSLFNMDFISLLLSIILILYFLYCIYIKRIKVDKIFILFTLLIVYKLAIGIIEGNKISLIFIDIRTTVYFLCTYLIFRYNKLNEKYLISLIKFGGFINSGIFLYFMYKMINQYGIGFRDVSFNLYISFFSLAIILLIDNKSLYNLMNVFIAIINIISIVLSQQRTLIIPLIVLIILFIKSNLKINLKSFILIISILIISYIAVRYIDKLGLLDVIKSRFSKELFSGESSTLNIRTDTMKAAFLESNIRTFIFGCGFGDKYSELELLIPNYIIKYGFIGFIFVFVYFSTCILNKIKFYSDFQKYILRIYLVMSIGGIISGFGGAPGQMLNGVVLGILMNDNLFNLDKINKYNTNKVKFYYNIN